MTGFDAAWLLAYQTKRAAQAASVVPAATGAITLKLARPTILLNPLLRLHWRARGLLASSISTELARQIPPNLQPIQHAKVTISRYSLGEPDYDGAVGGSKLTVDCLLPPSRRHPHGLNVIVDDDPSHLTLVVKSIVVASSKEQRTEILIEPLGVATAPQEPLPAPAD